MNEIENHIKILYKEDYENFTSKIKDINSIELKFFKDYLKNKLVVIYIFDWYTDFHKYDIILSIDENLMLHGGEKYKYLYNKYLNDYLRLRKMNILL